MSKVVVINHVTLDGVMQSPGRADEDPRDGFGHGGWAAPNVDEVVMEAVGGVVSIVHVYVVSGPVLPAASVALTTNV